MRNDFFLWIYNGHVVVIYHVDWKYYIINSKLEKIELKKSDFTFIA